LVALRSGSPAAEIGLQASPERVRTAQIGINLLSTARVELAQTVEDMVVVGTELRQVPWKLYQLTGAVTLAVNKVRGVLFLEFSTLMPVLLDRVEELRIVRRNEELPTRL